MEFENLLNVCHKEVPETPSDTYRSEEHVGEFFSSLDPLVIENQEHTISSSEQRKDIVAQVPSDSSQSKEHIYVSSTSFDSLPIEIPLEEFTSLEQRNNKECESIDTQTRGKPVNRIDYNTTKNPISHNKATQWY